MVHVERYYPVRARAEQPSEKAGPVKLSLSKCGLLDSFVLEEQCPQAPRADEVEVAVKCIGLNFRDVIVALGLIHHPDELGCEGSGIVHRVGQGVSHLKPGDKVIFICNGGLRSRITLHNALVSPMPDMLSFDEAATLLLVYMTVIYGLVKLGGLTREKSVLIHSACGGVGIAAINIFQKFGAQIYATVGNKDKAAYLADHLGIPSSRIFHSRDVSFVSDLMRETDGRGADLVLNSLTGELLQASLKCVAIGGTLLEIGKRDFISNTMIPMNLLAQGKRFVGVDAEYLVRHESKTAKEIIRLMLNYIEDGSIPPISPITRFPAGEISKAFKHMQKGDHIGKIVIDMPSETEPTFRKPRRNHRQISPDRAYLLVGGLGGIGRTISNWLVENGATCLVYLSPSAGTKPEHQVFFDELAAQGCCAIAVPGSAANMEAVRQAITQAPKPIAGVFQLSLVLKDSAISTMAHEVWRQPLEPKVSGTWNLHHALQNQSLDFFVLFGSLSGAVGLGGQANYGAANTFLTAFAGYRASIGQPASVIDLGVMTEVGYVSRNVDLVEALSSLGCPQVRERDLLTALQQLIDHENTADPRFPSNHLALGLGVNREYPRLEARILALQNAPENRDRAADGDRDADEIQALLDQIDANPKVLDHRETEEFLIIKIGNMVHPQSRDDEKGMNLHFLSKIAIDSLIAIEARTWARRKLGVDITLTEISSSKNVADLGKLALKALRQKYAQFLDKGETS